MEDAYDMEGEMTEEESKETLRDRRMERGGVDGNTRYDRAPKAPNTKKFGTSGFKKNGEKRSGTTEVTKAEIRAKLTELRYDACSSKKHSKRFFRDSSCHPRMASTTPETAKAMLME